MSLSASALSVLLMLGLQAPAHPDFSGRWVLVGSASALAGVPALLVVQQHLQRTDARGNPMTPFWDFLTVEAGDSRSAIRSGSYRIGVGGGVVGGITFPRRMTLESVRWDRDTLIVTSEEWMERQDGTRESYEQHTEFWALDREGRLTITVSGSSGEPATRKVIYEKEQARR
jgi:hypothetical protein